MESEEGGGDLSVVYNNLRHFTTETDRAHTLEARWVFNILAIYIQNRRTELTRQLSPIVCPYL